MRNNSLLTAIVVGIVGIVLIIFEGRAELLNWIVIVLGFGFILPGVFNLISQFSSPSGKRSTSSIIAAVGCVILGIVLCAVPGVFVNILIYLFAFTLVVGGIAQMVSIADFKLPLGFYIIPALVAITGLIMVFAGAEKDASAIVLVTGIAMVLYSANLFVEYFQLRKYKATGRLSERQS